MWFISHWNWKKELILTISFITINIVLYFLDILFKTKQKQIITMLQLMTFYDLTWRTKEKHLSNQHLTKTKPLILKIFYDLTNQTWYSLMNSIFFNYLSFSSKFSSWKHHRASAQLKQPIFEEGKAWSGLPNKRNSKSKETRAAH